MRGVKLPLIVAGLSLVLCAQHVTVPSSGGGLIKATFASPPAVKVVNAAYLFTDASGTGTCSGGGTAYAICVWDGATFVAAAGSSTGLGDPGANSVVYRNGAGTSIPATATQMSSANFCPDAGANDTYACNLSPVIASYVTGTLYWFKANTANTGAASVNFNSKGALPIKKMIGGITTDLSTGDIAAGQWVACIYDGTNCEMASQLGTAVDTSSTQTLTNKTIDGVSPATMAFVDPTSSVQTQLNGKASIAGTNNFTGTENGGGAASTTPARTNTVASITGSSCSTGEMAFATDASPGNNLYVCTAPNTWQQLAGIGGTLTVKVGITAAGSESTLAFFPGTGVTIVPTHPAGQVNLNVGLDTAVVETKASEQTGAVLYTASASGNGAHYTAAMTPTLSSYHTGMVIHWQPDVDAVNGGTCIAVDGLICASIKMPDGTTDPTSADIIGDGRTYDLHYDGTLFRLQGGTGSGSSVVAGAPYTQSFVAQTSVVLSHNLGLVPTTAFVLDCFTADTPPIRIQPSLVTVTDLNNITVGFGAVSETGSCTVATGGKGNAAGTNHVIQGTDGAGNFQSSGCTGTANAITCSGGFLSGSGSAPVLQKFFGTAPPGSVAGNLPGDLYTDTTNHLEYYCGATPSTGAPACTTVGTGQWSTVGASGITGSGTTNRLSLFSGASTIGSSNLWQGASTGELLPQKTINYAAFTAPTYNAGGTTTVDFTSSNGASVTVSGGNTTFAFTAPTNAGTVIIDLLRDSTARTLAWPANAYGFPTWVPGDSKEQLILATFNGTNFLYSGSFCPTCTYSLGAETAFSGVPTPVSGIDGFYFDSTAHTAGSKDSSGNQYLMGRVSSNCTNQVQIGLLNTGLPNCATLVAAYLPAATVYNNQANAYTAGFKQSFQTSATTAGLRMVGVSADPSTPAEGDFWYRSDTFWPSAYLHSAVHRFPTVTATPTSGNCAQWDSGTTLGDSGSPCGSSGGGVASFNGKTGTVLLDATDTPKAMYCAASASANAPTCSTSSGNYPSYASGQSLTVKWNVTNTGAATINVDSNGNRNIKRADGSATALAAGQLIAGVTYTLVDDGTEFLCTTCSIGTVDGKSTPTLLLDATDTSKTTYCAASASANAPTCATSNANYPAYAAGQTITVLWNITNTAAASVNVDSRGSRNIRRADGSATVLAAGQLIAGVTYTFVDDGTEFLCTTCSIGTINGKSTPTLLLDATDTSKTTYCAASASANTPTCATSNANYPAYAAGQALAVKWNITNTSGTVTINVDGLGTRNVTRRDGTALWAGQLVGGAVYRFMDDGTQFECSDCQTPPYVLNKQTATGSINGNSADQVIYSYTLKGNTLLSNGCFTIKGALVHDTGTNTSVAIKLKYGGNQPSTSTMTVGNNTNWQLMDFMICNNNATNSQVVIAGGSFGGATVKGTISTDSTADQTVEIDFNVASGDHMTGEYFSSLLVQ